MELQDFQRYLPERTYEILTKSLEFSLTTIKNIQKEISDYLEINDLDKTQLCFVVVGSLGRKEAMEASDVDLIPVVKEPYYSTFVGHDKIIREKIRSALGVKVSSGDELTKCVTIQDLVDPNNIGGENDNNKQLTKRILILTEGSQAGGEYKLTDIQSEILRAYSQYDSTRGKHVLTLCNDLARYYRTLCIEYKAKVDVEGKDWTTRNAKLRHSRKVWYFTCILSIAAKSVDNLHDTVKFKEELLKIFALPPVTRLFVSTTREQYAHVSLLLEYYSWFLKFMSCSENRTNLSKILYDSRYSDVNSVYYPVKLNSDMVHLQLLEIIEALPKNTRKKILDWFLL